MTDARAEPRKPRYLRTESRAILLLMQSDPILEWRRLSEHYRQMGDEELRELAADFTDLTETAQQALRSEMHSRGLGEAEDVNRAPEGWRPTTMRTASMTPLESNSIYTNAAGVLGARQPELVPDADDTETEKSEPHEYTWKTPLCECDGREEAMQLQKVLSVAGIECWFSLDGQTTSFMPASAQWFGVGGIQVLVAADQLEQAREIAARPIPQEIIEDLKAEVPDYEAPKCPRCRAEDPILEAAEPENRWRCEQCGEEWVDSGDGGDSDAAEKR